LTPKGLGARSASLVAGRLYLLFSITRALAQLEPAGATGFFVAQFVVCLMRPELSGLKEPFARLGRTIFRSLATRSALRQGLQRAES
jgi:hypothetical protein